MGSGFEVFEPDLTSLIDYHGMVDYVGVTRT